jgi:peroxiredoxin
VFYRGVWCPYCNIALSAYQADLLPQRGFRLVAISPRKPDGSLTMAQKHDLAFPVVSDPGNVTARRLGILTRPSPEARAAQLQLRLDLTRVNADGTVALPMPAAVILDAGRTIRWIDVHPDRSNRSNRSRFSTPSARPAADQRRPGAREPFSRAWPVPAGPARAGAGARPGPGR